MKASARNAVRERAHQRCEYCQLHQDDDPFPFHVEHIVAKVHGGRDDAVNLAWSCRECNSHKGPNLAGWLKRTDEIVALFHPRRQSWNRHFRWHGPQLQGRTKAARATIAVLQLNNADRVAVRQGLITAGLFPPQLSR